MESAIPEAWDRLQQLEELVLGRRTFHSSMFDDDEGVEIG